MGDKEPTASKFGHDGIVHAKDREGFHFRFEAVRATITNVTHGQ